MFDSTEIQVSSQPTFNFGEHLVRVIVLEGEPWFVAKDVCAALFLTNSRVALKALDDDEKGVSSTYTLGGGQKMAVVNESGLYTLILRCRDAVKQGSRAHAFRKWMTSEVLPTIRKTGSYQQPIAHLTPAVQLDAPSLKNRRWLVSFDHTGREVVQAVPVDALVVTAAELPKLILHSDTFTGREVYDIAFHANLRMMEETTHIGAVSDLEQLRKTVRELPSHELTTLTRDAWMELGLQTVNGGQPRGVH